MKKCNKCKKNLPFRDFHKNKKSPDCMDYCCKQCSKEKVVEWIKNNREKNRETAKKSTRKWRQLNPDENKRRQKIYQKEFHLKNTKRIEIVGTVRDYFESIKI